MNLMIVSTENVRLYPMGIVYLVVSKIEWKISWNYLAALSAQVFHHLVQKAFIKIPS